MAQFLEHCDADKEKLESIGRSLAAFGGLEGIPKLGNCAERIAAYAKALHYREMEFISINFRERNGARESVQEKKKEIAESLIQIFKKLGLQEAAEGVLQFAKNNEIDVSAHWYEKLNQWEEAKNLYQDDLSSENQLGYMRCLEVTGRFKNIKEICKSIFRKF